MPKWKNNFEFKKITKWFIYLIMLKWALAKKKKKSLSSLLEQTE